MILLSISRWVRSLDEVEKGDDREMIVCGPVLVFVEENYASDRYDTIHIVSGTTVGDCIPSYVSERDGDEFDVLNEEEWPDEACRVAAQLALIGKVAKTNG